MTVDFEIHNRVTGEVLADSHTTVSAAECIADTAAHRPRAVFGLVGDTAFHGPDPHPALVEAHEAAIRGDLVVVAVFSEDPS